MAAIRGLAEQRGAGARRFALESDECGFHVSVGESPRACSLSNPQVLRVTSSCFRSRPVPALQWLRLVAEGTAPAMQPLRRDRLSRGRRPGRAAAQRSRARSARASGILLRQTGRAGSGQPPARPLVCSLEVGWLLSVGARFEVGRHRLPHEAPIMERRDGQSPPSGSPLRSTPSSRSRRASPCAPWPVCAGGAAAVSSRSSWRASATARSWSSSG
jgi:hypothetical protein